MKDFLVKRVLPGFLIPAVGYFAFQEGAEYALQDSNINDTKLREIEILGTGFTAAGLAMGATHLAYRWQDNFQKHGISKGLNRGLKDAAIVGVFGAGLGAAISVGLYEINTTMAPEEGISNDIATATILAPSAITAASLGAYTGDKK